MLIDTISLELFQNTEQWLPNGHVFLHNGFFMLRDFRFRGRDFLLPHQPYRLLEGRVVWVKCGWARYSFNLVDYEFRAGDLVVFYADTLIEKQGHSDDFVFDAFTFVYDTERRIHSGFLSIDKAHLSLKGVQQAPVQKAIPTNIEKMTFARLRLNERTETIVDQYMSLLWTLVREQPFPENNVNLLIYSFLMFIRQQQVEKTDVRTNHREAVLRRFISLVSSHAATERNIPYYANQLCLTPHYLSTLVKQVSGRTVMQWINQSAVKEIKVWLAYSDEGISQIADRLSFPDTSTLTKFFKRETGETPTQYRDHFKLKG